jgi:hypothetical protein
MSEHLRHHEHKEAPRHAEKPEVHYGAEREHHAEKHETPEALPNVHELQEQAKAEARHAAEVSSKTESHAPEPEPVIGTQRQLKANAYRRTLQKVRTHLKPREKALSKFIHQPGIETLSEAGAKTAARPSGLLGGGLAALIGSGTLLYMSKHYGFRYNFFVFVLFFVGGFAAGVIIELLVRASNPRKPNRP